MPGKGNKYEAMARDAVKSIQAAMAVGEQLALLPDEVGGAGDLDSEGQRRVRGPGKAQTQVRDWLVAQGYRLPQDQLALMAGLGERENPDWIIGVLETAQKVLAAAFHGAKDKDGNPRKASPEQLIGLFTQLATLRLRATEALVPYVAPKVTPDAPTQLAVQIITAPAAPSGAPIRDVTPGPTRLADRRMVPADVRAEIVRNQGVAGGDQIHSDGAIRTEGATR